MTKELKDSGIVTALSVVGFVFGLIAMLCSFIPLLGSLAYFIGIPAAIISGIALAIAYSQNAKRTFAIVALTISLIGVAMAGLQYVTLLSAGKRAQQALGDMARTPSPPVKRKGASDEPASTAQLYEPATNVKRIDFNIYESDYSVAHGESIRVPHAATGLIHHSTFTFHVYRLKERHNSYLIKLTGQVDTETGLLEHIVKVDYETQGNTIQINETKKTLRILSIHPVITTKPNNNFLSDKDGRLYLLHKHSLYYKANESGDQWSRVVANVKAFAVDPANSTVIYTITERNLINKSMDGGKTWLTINNGLPSNSTCWDIIINPSNTQEAYVLNTSGLYRTGDAGFRWEQTTLHDCVYQLIIHLNQTNTYYALANSGVSISQDAGSTWSHINVQLPKTGLTGKGPVDNTPSIVVKAIALQSCDRPSLLALTEEHGILRTEDNGVSWSAFNNGFNKEDGAYCIYTLTNDIYIGSYGCVYHMKNDGDRWDKVNLTQTNQIGVEGITGLFPLEGGKGLMIADDTGRLANVANDNVLIGLNYGVTPHSKILHLMSVTGRNCIFASVYNPNYTDIENYGLFYSTDNGRTWDKSIIYSVSVMWPRLYVSPHSDKELWLFDNNDTTQVFYSVDGGTTWNQPDKFTFAALNSRFSCLAFDRKDPNIKYICDWGRVFRYDSKTKGITDLKIENAYSVVIAEDDPNMILAGFNVSTDSGWTWKDISTRKDSRGSDFSPMYFSSKKIVAFYNGCLIATDHLGPSWTVLKKIDVSTYIPVKGARQYVYANPLDRNNIFLGCQDGSGGPADKKRIVKIHQSVDQGITWKPFCVYEPGTQNVDSMVKDQCVTMTTASEGGKMAVYIGTMDGLYKTLDDGLTWKLLGGVENESAKLKISCAKVID